MTETCKASTTEIFALWLNSKEKGRIFQMVKIITWAENGKQILVFRNAEPEYLDYVQNRNVWVANCELRGGAYMIHFSTCPLINGRAALRTARHYTDKGYYKLCCEDKITLMRYIRSQAWDAGDHAHCCARGDQLVRVSFEEKHSRVQ